MNLLLVIQLQDAYHFFWIFTRTSSSKIGIFKRLNLHTFSFSWKSRMLEVVNEILASLKQMTVLNTKKVLTPPLTIFKTNSRLRKCCFCVCSSSSEGYASAASMPESFAVFKLFQNMPAASNNLLRNAHAVCEASQLRTYLLSRSRSC